MNKVLLLVCLLTSTITFSQEESSEKVDSQNENLAVNENISSLNQNDLQDYKVFPNPTRNDVTVRLGNLTEGISFTIYDVLGKLVYNRKIVSYDLQNNSFKLDMSSFKDGVYMFSLKSKTAARTIKVVKL